MELRRLLLLCLTLVLIAAAERSATGQGACPTAWAQRFPTNTPFNRGNSAMVDAPGLGGVFLFGGGLSNFPAPDTYLDDLWKWNGTTWTSLNPNPRPSARYDTAIAYDSTRNRLFMYGGALNRGGLSDAWLFNGTTWTDITSPITSAPGPRLGHRMVYDPVRDRMIMFGGSTSQDPRLATYHYDTWEFDPGALTWTQVQPDAAITPARSSGGFVFDTARSLPIAYGGVTSSPNSGVAAIYEWSGGTWTERTFNPLPPVRSQTGFAYDPIRGRAILYGGNDPNIGVVQGDTWEFDGTTWTQTQTAATGPGAATNQNQRWFVNLSYSSVNQAALHIMANTQPVGGGGNQTWLYTGAQPPSIVSGPGSTLAVPCGAVVLNASVNIPAGVTGTAQWQRNGVNISNGPGGASPGGGTVVGAVGGFPSSGPNVVIALIINGVQAGDAGSYRLVVSSACGAAVFTAPATISVSDVATITTQPMPLTIPDHTVASFSARVTIPDGLPLGSYQWQRNGVDIVDGVGGASPGGGDVSFGSSGGLAGPVTDLLIPLTINAARISDAGEYRLVLNGLNGSCGPIISTPATLTVTPVPEDECASAPTLENGTYNFSVEGFGSSGPYENNRCGGAWGGFGADAWFRYTATCTGTLRISTCGSGFDTAVFLYPNAACPTNPGTILTCADNECGTNADLLYPVTIGDTFLVRLGGFNFDSSQVNLTISCSAPPAFPSDHCEDAPFIAMGSYSFSTVGSDTDGLIESGGDGGQGGDCAIGGGFQIDHDRWFRVLVPCTGAISISLCGSDFDTRLMVYEGSACPTQPGTYVACGDNQCTLNARVGSNLTAGEIYLIRVGGANGASGNVQLNLTCLATPPADSCANAPTLTDGVYDFYTWDTTTDGPDEPGTCDDSWPGCDNDVWFRYIASCTGTATISLCGSSFDTKMFIYPGTGCPTEGGTTIDCSDDVCGTQSESTIPVTAGQSFLVRVGGVFGDAGPVHMTITCMTASPCLVDFNADGFLNQEDLGGFLTAFLDESIPPGPTGTNSAPCPDEPAPYNTLGYAADYNRDCSFNQEDLSGFITEYFSQTENPTSCIPG